MNAIIEGRRPLHDRLGLSALVERHEYVSARLDGGGVGWQSLMVDNLLLDPLIRGNGECITLEFTLIADHFDEWGLVERDRFFRLGEDDHHSPAATVAAYAHHLHLCRLVSYSTENLDNRAWIFTNGASLRSAMGLPFRGSLHFEDRPAFASSDTALASE